MSKKHGVVGKAVGELQGSGYLSGKRKSSDPLLRYKPVGECVVPAGSKQPLRCRRAGAVWKAGEQQTLVAQK